MFDGEKKQFELLENHFYYTMLKTQPETTQTKEMNHSHAHFRKEALNAFRNMNASNKRTPEDVFKKYRLKYVISESRAAAKHK